MDIEKAIEVLKRLKIAMVTSTVDGDRILEPLIMGIEALENQIPKKPKYDHIKHLHICPNCGEFLQTYNEKQKYSMCCGQKLYWN